MGLQVGGVAEAQVDGMAGGLFGAYGGLCASSLSEAVDGTSPRSPYWRASPAAFTHPLLHRIRSCIAQADIDITHPAGFVRYPQNEGW